MTTIKRLITKLVKKCKTSLLLQMDTRGCINKHTNISGIQLKLRSSNRIPNGNPTRLWLRIYGHQQNQTLILLPKKQREESQHNPKWVALPSITDRGRNTKIRPRRYDPKGKPQTSKVSPERSSFRKNNRQRRITWQGTTPNNWLIMSHQKRGSRPTLGGQKLLDRWERRTLYQNTRNP